MASLLNQPCVPSFAPRLFFLPLSGASLRNPHVTLACSTPASFDCELTGEGGGFLGQLLALKHLRIFRFEYKPYLFQIFSDALLEAVGDHLGVR